MSHTTRFEALGWESAVLIHDGLDMRGPVELRGWYPELDKTPPELRDPDYVAILHGDGRIELKASCSAPIVQATSTYEQTLVFRAGVAIGSGRLTAAVTKVLETHES